MNGRTRRFLATAVTTIVLATGSALADIPQSERDALIAVYDATGGSGWTDGTGWLGPAGTECTWFGVICNGDESAVTGLSLPGNQLSGPFPASIEDLTQLEVLSLEFNILVGPIPASIGSLSNLTHFDAGFNKFNGAIPAALGNLSQLEWLALPGNLLTGSIPDSLGTLTQLRLLHLWENQLSGSIPSSLTGLVALESFDLHGNRLGGALPAAVGNLTALQSLVLSDNVLRGEVPRSMINLVNLMDEGGLDLCGNTLYTDDQELRDFLDAKHGSGDWQACQLTGGVEPRDETPVSLPEAEVGLETGSDTDRNGNRVVVWQQTGGRVKDLVGNLVMTQQGAGILGRYFDPDDQPVGDVIEVATGAEASNPTVSFDGAGNFVIGWEVGGGVADGIFGRYFGSDQAPLTSTFQVDDEVGVEAEAPRVASAAAGDFVMVWRGSDGKQAGDGVFGRFFDPNGTPKGDPVQVDGDDASAVSLPEVAADASGNSIVVWQQDTVTKQAGDGIFGRYFNPTGGPQTDPFQVDEDLVGEVSGPSVGSDSAGNVVVVWAQDVGGISGWEVFGRLLGAGGQFLGPQFVVNTDPEGNQVVPSVAVNPAGDIAVAWESGSDGIFGRFFTAGGVPLGPQFVVAETEEGLVPTAPEVSVAGDNSITVSYTKTAAAGTTQGVFLRTFDVATGPFACDPDATTNCLNSERFQVRVSWRDFADASGAGQAVALTDDTGYFWYFDQANVELMLKVLDATAINGHFWVFFGALSNVEYTIVVTDTETGASRTYFNPSGSFASVGDTEALPAGGKAVHSSFAFPLREWPGSTRESVDPAAAQACTPGSTNLCLNADRFRVEVEWADFQGNTGSGQAAPLTGDTGTFWFFDAANVELVIKVLDGRGINQHFWIFYGALSNVGYTITVTDSETGSVRTYTNPLGEFGSVGDTEAFFAP